ncbi:conserved hypothetical protein [Novosphingobium sp. 9U]|nr:conserved hypothetical protein [Novosphingobium sp. 9U]
MFDTFNPQGLGARASGGSGVHEAGDGTPARGPTSFGRGWIPADRDIGLPGDDCAPSRAGGSGAAPGESPNPSPSPEEEGLATAPPARNHNSWTPARKAAFLHHLAETGNVRASAARVGMTHQSAYLVRRRERPFRAAWAAALVLAREVAAQVLATQAIDGIEEQVWFRGERVGVKTRYDARLLLAHLARLDKAAEAEDAGLHAERFDELLATVAGEGPEEGLRDHGETWADPDPLLPHAREVWANRTADRAYNDAHRQWREEFDAALATKADEPETLYTSWFDAPLAEWDAWHPRACAAVDTAVAAESREVFPDWVEVVDEAEEWGCEDERDEWDRVPDWNDPVYRNDPPMEYKSMELGLQGPPPVGEVAGASAADGGVSPLAKCSDEGVTPLHRLRRSPSPCRGGSEFPQDTGNCGNSARSELPRNAPAQRLGAVAGGPAGGAGGGHAPLAHEAVEGARIGFGEAPLRAPGDRERDRRLGSVAHEVRRHHRHVDRLAGADRVFAAAG